MKRINRLKGINAMDISETNRGVALRTIHTYGPLTQSEIVKETGLKQPTISKVTRELLEVGIIEKEQVNNKDDSRGRPPEVFKLTSELVGIAVRVARHEIVSAFVDIKGKLYKKQHYSAHETRSREDLLKLVGEIIAENRHSSFAKNHLTTGIGIAVPGPVNIKSGEINLVTDKMGWSGVNFHELQTNELPLVVRQDADAAVVGEGLFGVGRDDTDVIFVAAGRGIGAGIMLEGSLVRSNEGFSGEFGHTTVEHDGVPCACGNKGCVERYASINALLEYLREKAERGKITYSAEDITFQSVIELTESGNKAVIDGVVRSAYYLGVGIANLVTLLTPRRIVLGDEMVQLGPVWIEEIKRMLNKRKCCWEDLQIVTSNLGEGVFLKGAGALALEKFINNPTLLTRPQRS